MKKASLVLIDNTTNEMFRIDPQNLVTDIVQFQDGTLFTEHEVEIFRTSPAAFKEQYA